MAADKDALLKRALHLYLDNAFIWIGGGGKDKDGERIKHDYRLHPTFAKDFGDVEDRLVKIVKEVYGD